MDSIKNILIGADKGVGKTYLVNKLKEELKDKNIQGYFTLMHKDKIDENNNGFKIYMYPANQSIENRKETKENYIGSCNKIDKTINKDIFAKLGVELLSEADKDDVVIMDEIGYFESDVDEFTKKVYEVLEGPNHVIATIKERYDNDYINNVRAYKDREDTIFIKLTKENRDEVFAQLEKIVKAW